MTTPTKTPALSPLEQFRAQAKIAQARGESLHSPVETLKQAAELVAQLPAQDPTAAALLAKRGLTPEFFSAVAQLGHDIQDARAGLPTNLARTQLLTDAERTLVADAGRLFRAVRTSVMDIAASQGQQAAARAFGRGSKWLDSAAGLSKAIGDFDTACTAERQPLLDAAGVTAADIKALQAHATQLTAVGTEKGGRRSKRTKASRESERAGLALQKAFGWYRARARLALLDDPAQLAAVLNRVPRRQDRRQGVVAAAAEVAAPVP